MITDDEFVDEFARYLRERIEERKRRESERLVIPAELDAVRDMVRRTILPIKSADDDQAESSPFRMVRTVAGDKLPPYYLIYFLLVDVLGFRSAGPTEKMAWSLTFDFEGAKYTIAHVKFGLRLFAREGQEWENQASRIVGLIHRGVSRAKPIFRWMAENAVRESKLNVRNVGIKLFKRYTFFRDGFRLAADEAHALRQKHEAETMQREFRFDLYQYSTRLKTHLATGLCVAACHQRRRVRFTTATGLINELAEAAHANQLSRALARWERLDLICIDELGYVPLAETACELMFQVIADRAEKAAVIVTTNLPFSEWSQVIPNPRLCKALIDRLTDQAHIITTGSDSYRFRRTTAQRKATKP